MSFMQDRIKANAGLGAMTIVLAPLMDMHMHSTFNVLTA